MSTLRKMICVCVMAAMLVMAFPISSFAVDPVSTATMANAFAQAITAYGASQGVSMMFDISNTSQIGEQVHELWKRFRSDQQTTDDYETIAAAVWPGLYNKVQRVAGAVVGIKLAAEYVADLDGFWNWVLSGPAEMQKVDDAYAWSLNQDGTVTPVAVYTASPIPGQPVPYWGVPSPNDLSPAYSASYKVWSYVNTRTQGILPISSDYPIYCFAVNDVYYVCSNHEVGWWAITKSQTNTYSYTNPSRSSNYRDTSTRLYYNQYGETVSNIQNLDQFYCPTFNSLSDGLQFIKNVIDGNVASASLSVAPYIGDTAPQDVYIPDNKDVNYVPIPANIPLDIPWDDSLYGDGQVLTDAQSQEIAEELDLAISNTDTLELSEPIDIPADPPSEVYVPLLPVELPSFNFSLSGIWHYVVSWVQSLGAWLTLMFQTWAVLPSAITIPVYATAVIVIVLGVYKRFFM